MGPARFGGVGPAAAALLVALIVAIIAGVMVMTGGGFNRPIATTQVASPIPTAAHGG